MYLRHRRLSATQHQSGQFITQKHSLQLLGTEMQSLCCPTCTLPTILCDPHFFYHKHSSYNCSSLSTFHSSEALQRMSNVITIQPCQYKYQNSAQIHLLLKLLPPLHTQTVYLQSIYSFHVQTSLQPTYTSTMSGQCLNSSEQQQLPDSTVINSTTHNHSLQANRCPDSKKILYVL